MGIQGTWSPEDLQEGEQVDPPTIGGRTSRELWQILRDATDFVKAPQDVKRQRKQPKRYQTLVAQVGEPSSFQEEAQHYVWVDVMVEEYISIMINDILEVVPRPQDR